MHRRIISTIRMALALFSLCIPSVLLAQEDAEGSKDLPYISRMPGFFIIESEQKDFEAYKFYDGKKIVSIEGKYYQNHYEQKEGAASVVSALQIRRNYLNALRSAGATILFQGNVDTFDDTRSGADIIWAKMSKGGQEIWIEVWPRGDNEYFLTVIEKEAMRQEVTADSMLASLQSEGHIALYILFDTGKSIIKPESAPIIDEIVSLLKNHADLKLSIEGHTDNVGSPASNKTLSEARAKAVLEDIAKKGILTVRLSSVGWGQDKPIADNNSDEGRAKNRRVELVKK